MDVLQWQQNKASQLLALIKYIFLKAVVHKILLGPFLNTLIDILGCY